MIQNNEKKILSILKNTDLVLDIGGWDKPFNRANYVLDIHPFKTRGFHGSHGGNKEFFNEKRWIIHDVCSKEKLPFKDKQFDFVICSQILEDIRDPIWLCSEIIRIGKAGYIEIPSMKIELSKGIMNKKYAGYYHHRWLIEIKKNTLKFRFKPHFIHNDRRFYFPKNTIKKIAKLDENQFLFWVNNFYFKEIIQISRDKSEDFIYNYIKKIYPRKYFYSILKLKMKLNNFLNKILINILPNHYCHKYMNTKEIISI